MPEIGNSMPGIQLDMCWPITFISSMYLWWFVLAYMLLNLGTMSCSLHWSNMALGDKYHWLSSATAQSICNCITIGSPHIQTWVYENQPFDNLIQGIDKVYVSVMICVHGIICLCLPFHLLTPVWLPCSIYRQHASVPVSTSIECNVNLDHHHFNNGDILFFFLKHPTKK